MGPIESQNEPRYTDKELLDCLREFVNYGDEEKALARMLKDYREVFDGILLDVLGIPTHMSDTKFAAVHLNHKPSRERLRRKLQMLRTVWSGEFPLPKAQTFPLKNGRVLSTVFDHGSGHRGDRRAALEDLLGLAEAGESRVVPSWETCGFAYIPRNWFERAVWRLLERAATVKKCANPQCKGPQYIFVRDARHDYCEKKTCKNYGRSEAVKRYNKPKTRKG